MSGEEKLKITIEDVKNAIKIINVWIDQQEEVKKTMVKLRRFMGAERYGYGFSLEGIIRAALEEAERRRGLGVTIAPETETVSEEELTKIREIAEKIKKGEVKSNERRGF
ncbi:MAG: hypothetical protein QW734_09390 [Candidatus Bathyarchaeia archaeon]